MGRRDRHREAAQYRDCFWPVSPVQWHDASSDGRVAVRTMLADAALSHISAILQRAEKGRFNKQVKPLQRRRSLSTVRL